MHNRFFVPGIPGKPDPRTVDAMPKPKGDDYPLPEYIIDAMMPEIKRALDQAVWKKAQTSRGGGK